VVSPQGSAPCTAAPAASTGVSTAPLRGARAWGEGNGRSHEAWSVTQPVGRFDVRTERGAEGMCVFRGGLGGLAPLNPATPTSEPPYVPRATRPVVRRLPRPGAQLPDHAGENRRPADRSGVDRGGGETAAAGARRHSGRCTRCASGCPRTHPGGSGRPDLTPAETAESWRDSRRYAPLCTVLHSRGRRDSNPQPPDRQTGLVSPSWTAKAPEFPALCAVPRRVARPRKGMRNGARTRGSGLNDRLNTRYGWNSQAAPTS
jgi:hypothetical protein